MIDRDRPQEAHLRRGRLERLGDQPAGVPAVGDVGEAAEAIVDVHGSSPRAQAASPPRGRDVVGGWWDHQR
jgi:hypothetical protein